MRAIPILATLALLSACGTPQEQCIRLGTRDLIVLDRLIADSRATLHRGYALQEVEVDNWVWVTCGPPPMVNGQAVGPPERCFENVPRLEVRPRAVNLAEERAKLAGMEDRHRDLARAAQPVVAACQAKYPQ